MPYLFMAVVVALWPLALTVIVICALFMSGAHDPKDRADFCLFVMFGVALGLLECGLYAVTGGWSRIVLILLVHAISGIVTWASVLVLRIAIGERKESERIREGCPY